MARCVLGMQSSWVLRSILNRGVTVKTLSALLAAALLATLCGCNTVEGAGKDVKATGQAVENAADKAKPK